MKKTYSKPSILIENFALSTNIAANCDKPFNLQVQFVCGIPNDSGVPGMDIFDPTLGGSCVFPGDGDSAIYDGFCYHIPTETNELFNS